MWTCPGRRLSQNYESQFELSSEWELHKQTDGMAMAGSQAARGGKRCALVIGNSEYQRTAPLANAANDAVEVSRALKRMGWDVSVRQNLNRGAMEDALDAFRVKMEGCAAALFYFAGHGTNIWGQNYLLPVDARIEFEDHVHRRSFFLGNILEGMVDRAGVSVALIDACQENPFQRSATRSLNTDYRSGGRSGSGLAYIKAPQGAFVAFAASPGELAYDTPGKHSPFTSALLESLADDEGEITDVFTHVQDRVFAATSGAQRPWMHSDLPGPFYMSSLGEGPRASAPVARSDSNRPSVTVGGHAVAAKLRVTPAATRVTPTPQPSSQPQRQAQDTASPRPPERVKTATAPVSSERPADTPAPAPISVPAHAPIGPTLPAGTQLSINNIGEMAGQLALALGAAEWERLRNTRDIALLTRFAEHFPGYYGELARDRAHQLSSEAREHSNWLWASQRDSVEAYQRFLAVWPHGRYSSIAHGRLQELDEGQKQVHRQTKARAEGDAQDIKLRSEGLAQVDVTVDDGVKTELLKIGHVFRDSDIAPELVIVPGGTFTMGSGEEKAHPSELPEHRVVIPRALAVGLYPITFEEWDAAYDAGGVLHQPSDKRWGRGRRPVINVSWMDAQSYVEWLSEETGHTYRLLTEAEWEYCCRAGTTTTYATGSYLGRKAAHCSFDHWGCAGKTVEVGQFDDNRFGLFDMHGNVAEWVQDTWTDTYSDAPGDGSAFAGDRQSPKVVRGGGWPDVPRSLRSSSRNRLKASTRNDHTGFRVARVLTAKTRSDNAK